MEDDSRQAPSGPVEQAVSPAGERTSPGLDRRKFIGALGGAAAAAAFLGSQGAAGSGQGANPPPILYQDSFGDIGPANPAALAAGIVPPPVPSQASAAAGSGTTFVTQASPQPKSRFGPVWAHRACQSPGPRRGDRCPAGAGPGICRRR